MNFPHIIALEITQYLFPYLKNFLKYIVPDIIIFNLSLPIIIIGGKLLFFFFDIFYKIYNLLFIC